MEQITKIEGVVLQTVHPTGMDKCVEMDHKSIPVERRTVLKTLGTIGTATALSGTAIAHDDDGNGRPWGTFTWADDILWEMADTDLQALFENPPTIESNGNPNAHAPLWLVGSMDDYSKADMVDGTEHSPHPNPLGARVDHVVPLGKDFNVQWHVHLVIRPNQMNDLEAALEAAANGDFGAVVSFLNTLPHGDGKGEILTSAATIEDAVARGDRIEVPLFTPSGEPDVFTCPIRPH